MTEEKKAEDKGADVIYVDFRKRCRADAMPDDPVYEQINCGNCPLSDQCMWLVKIFKRKLCPFF